MQTIIDYFDDNGKLLKGQSKLIRLAKNMAKPSSASDYLCPEGVCGKGPKFPAADPNGVWVSTFYILKQAKDFDPKVLRVILVRLYRKYKHFDLAIPRKLQLLAASLMTKKKEPKPKPTEEDLKKKLEHQIQLYETKAHKMPPVKRRMLAKQLKAHAKQLNVVLPDGSVINAYSRSNPSKGTYTMMIQRTKVTGDPRYKAIPDIALHDIDHAIGLVSMLDRLHGLTYDDLPDPVMALTEPIGPIGPPIKAMHTSPIMVARISGVVDPEIMETIADMLSSGMSGGLLDLLRGTID